MAIFTLLALAALVALLAVFFSSDADLLLYLAPNPPANAFQGQVVWVVGASGGIGAQLAKDYAKLGAQVVLSARREKELQELADESKQFGLEPLVLPFDIVNYEDHAPAFQKIVKKFGKVDVLVLNAGRSQRDLALETPISVTEDLMKLNFHSFVNLNNVVMPSMVERKSGQLIIIGSVAGLVPTTISSSYSATKYAQRGYFGALRSEVSKDNISVSLVSPGPVHSDIFKNSVKSSKFKQSESEKKVSTERCSELIVKGTYHKLDEMWIALQPILAIAYVATYAPGFFRYVLSNVIGPARVKAFITGGDVYDFNQILFNK